MMLKRQARWLARASSSTVPAQNGLGRQLPAPRGLLGAAPCVHCARLTCATSHRSDRVFRTIEGTDFSGGRHFASSSRAHGAKYKEKLAAREAQGQQQRSNPAPPHPSSSPFSLNGKGKGLARVPSSAPPKKQQPGKIPQLTTAPPVTSSTSNRPPRDEEIHAAKVRLVHPVPEGSILIPAPSHSGESEQGKSEDGVEQLGEAGSSVDAETTAESLPQAKKKKAGGLAPPESLESVLSRMDRKNYWLQQVAVAPARRDNSGQVEEDQEAAWPIVKIVSKKDLFDRAKAKSSSSSKESTSSSGSSSTGAGDAPPLKQKELQLSWSVSPHDLSHKIARSVQDCHLKGNKVRVTIVVRKGQGKAFWEEGAEQRHAELLRRIEEEMTAGNESDEGWEVRREGSVKWRGQTIAVVEYTPVGRRRSSA